MFRVPSPPELGLYGSFNAFRVLEQDVFTFERYLDKAAKGIAGPSEGGRPAAAGNGGAHQQE